MKNNTLRLMTFGAIATLALASCKKNNGTEGNASENGFRATIEQPAGNGNGSRTHIDPDWANDASTDILWTTEDLIKVANGNGTVLNYQITEGENTVNGTFYTGEEHETFFQPNYAAIYPAFNAEDVANGISGTTATFNVPQTQTYRANSFAEKSMPMVAYSTDQTLAFKNVFGGICIPLVGDGLRVTRVVLTSANASEHLYGTFTADCTSATPAPTYVSGGGNSLTLDCSATPVTLNATTPTYFCFMVPPASLASGFTVTPYNGETAYEELSTAANPGIMRSMIKKVSTSLTVEEAVVTPAVPTGAINGKFTINGDGDQVYFSQGNLQYIGSAGSGSADDNNAGASWKFADHQFDYFGDNGQGSTTIKQDRDLFGWGTSGINDYTPIATCWQPWSTSTTSSQYNPYGSTSTHLNSDPGKADWGYNAISNGGNQAGNISGRIAWCTLTNAEWGYLFNSRETGKTVNGTLNARYTEATINTDGSSVNGIILFPDGYSGPTSSSSTDGITFGTINGTSAWATKCTTAGWQALEAAGCVFLPAAGYRNGTSVLTAGTNGYYWSSTYDYINSAYRLGFYSGSVSPQYYSRRDLGFSVRLVCPAE